MSPPKTNPDDTGLDQAAEAQGGQELPLFKNIRMPKTLKYKDAQGNSQTANSRPPFLAVDDTDLSGGAAKQPGRIYVNTAGITKVSTEARTAFYKALTTAPTATPPNPPKPAPFTGLVATQLSQVIYKKSPNFNAANPPDAANLHVPEFNQALDRAKAEFTSYANNKKLSSQEGWERATKVKDRLVQQISTVHQRQQTDLETYLKQTPPAVPSAYTDEQKQVARDALKKVQADEKAAVEKYANDAVSTFHKRLSDEQFRANILRLGEIDPNFAKHIEEKAIGDGNTHLFGVDENNQPLTSDLSAKLGTPDQFPAYKHKDYPDVTVARLGGNNLSIKMPPYPKDEKKLRAAAELAVRAAINEGYPGIKVNGNTELAKYIWLYSKEIGYRCTLAGGETPELMRMYNAEQARKGVTSRGAAASAMQETPYLAQDIQSGAVTIPLHIADKNLRAVTAASVISQRAQESIDLYVGGDLPKQTQTVVLTAPTSATFADLKARVDTIAENHRADEQALSQLAGITGEMQTLSGAIKTKLDNQESWLQRDDKLSIHVAPPGKAAYKMGKNQGDYVAQVEENAATVSGAKKEDVRLDSLTAEEKRFAEKAYRETQIPLIQEELRTLDRMQSRLGGPEVAVTLAALKANNEARTTALLETAGYAGPGAMPGSNNNQYYTTKADIQIIVEGQKPPTVDQAVYDRLQARLSDNNDPLKQYVDQYRQLQAFDRQLTSLQSRITQTAQDIPNLSAQLNAVPRPTSTENALFFRPT